jgi:1-acyl-sn-glycerol-3-phosphate acyltransferase
MSASIRFVARKIFPLIADINFIGHPDQLPKGGYILAANHLGRLDSMMVYVIVDNDDIIHPLTDKYKKYFWSRVAARFLKMTWLTRGQPDMKAMREFIARLRAGGVMVITPEGTRSKTAQLLKGESGAIFIANQAGVPIVPVGLIGTEDAVVIDRLKHFKKLKITANIGEAYTIAPIKGADRDRLMQEATDDLMCRIAALLPESYRGYYKDSVRVKEIVEGQKGKGA